jgi:hypothetical protein
VPNFTPGDEKNKLRDFSIPGGDYLIALRSFERKSSKKGTDYLKCKWVVCGGKLLWKSFFSGMSCNLAVDGTCLRWQLLCEACEVTDPFELGSFAEGTNEEGDRDITRLFVGRPFAARIRRTINGQYTNNDIERFLLGPDSERFEALKATWFEEHLPKMLTRGSPEESVVAADADAGASFGAAEDDDFPF